MRPLPGAGADIAAAIVQRAARISSAPDFRRKVELVDFAGAISPATVHAIVIAVLTVASVAHPASDAEDQIAFAGGMTDFSEPPPVRVITNFVIVVVAETIVDIRIESVVTRQLIVQAEAGAGVVE